MRALFRAEASGIRSTSFLALSLAAAALTGACGDDEPEGSPGLGIDIPEDAEWLAEVRLGAPPTSAPDGSPFSPPEPELYQVLERLEAVRTASPIRGVLVRLGPMGGAFGRAEDVARALAEVRKAGKPVHCHFEATDNLGYRVLVESCDRITMTPGGILDLVGPAAHVFYARTLLEHMGIRAELVQVGRFKGAADPLTRDDMPDEVRRTLGAVLDAIKTRLVEAIVEHRNRSAEEVSALLDAGPYGARDAEAAGLVDAVGFVDQAREHARHAAEATRTETVPLAAQREPMRIGDLLEALIAEEPEEPPYEPHIVLASLTGTIADGTRPSAGTTRSGPFVAAMNGFARDESVKAVVLHIDSPGGSALASDRMWHAVRRVAAKKPIIASVSDMAASGGYYVASAATEIFAHDLSLVGSIGVVGGKVQLSELASRVGVHAEVMTRGKNAAWASPTRPFSESERATLERLLHRTYARFLHRVMTARGMSREALDRVAEGRIMTGARALEGGLVDATGGLSLALARARSAAGVPEDTPVRRWPEEQGFLARLSGRLGGARNPGAAAIANDVLSELGPEAEAVAESLALLRLLGGPEKVALALPYAVRLR